ncbi:hypothetical protein ACSFB8_07630 [Enterococcus faecalis]
MEKKQTTLRLPVDLYEALMNLSDYLGISFNSLVKQKLKESTTFYRHLL